MQITLHQCTNAMSREDPQGHSQLLITMLVFTIRIFYPSLIHIHVVTTIYRGLSIIPRDASHLPQPPRGGLRMIAIPRLEWTRPTEVNIQTSTDRIITGLIIRRLLQALGNVPRVPRLTLIPHDRKKRKFGIVQIPGTYPRRIKVSGKTGSLCQRPP